MSDQNTRKSIGVFLILTFGLPLICVFIIKNFILFQSGIPYFVVYGIEAMTPSLSALITIKIISGNSGIRTFLKKCYFNNTKIRYIALAVILPSAVLTMTKMTWLAISGSTVFSAGITVKKLIVVMWALVAEELGWRGFLQDKLDKGRGCIVTSALIGVIWALWHYHFFWLGTNSAPPVLFIAGCIFESFGYYLVTEKSHGNIIPASIWHFTGNLFFSLYMISPECNNGSTMPYIIYCVYLGIMAIGTIHLSPVSKRPLHT